MEKNKEKNPYATNSADRIEAISPVRPDKCPPIIENSDVTLWEICTQKAHALYGEQLPAIVEERMNKELDAIIGNGYAVMYIIAQKLVWKSVSEGYLVGSRGSVGGCNYPPTAHRHISFEVRPPVCTRKGGASTSRPHAK